MLGSHTQLLGLKASSNHAAKFLKKVLKLKLYQWAKRWPSGLDTDETPASHTGFLDLDRLCSSSRSRGTQQVRKEAASLPPTWERQTASRSQLRPGAGCCRHLGSEPTHGHAPPSNKSKLPKFGGKKVFRISFAQLPVHPSAPSAPSMPTRSEVRAQLRSVSSLPLLRR